MENLPVFNSSDEYRLWKVLNGKVPENRLESITNKILSSDGFIHPAILTSLMDVLSRDNKKVPTDTLISLASKSRPQDSSPTVRAVSLPSWNSPAPFGGGGSAAASSRGA